MTEKEILLQFPPGYNPRAGIDNRVVMTPNCDKHLDGWGAFKLWDSQGLIAHCTEPEKFREWIERKACMDLSIAMWKAWWKSVIEEDGTRFVGIFELWELMQDFPDSWLEKTGLFKAAMTSAEEVRRLYERPA